MHSINVCYLGNMTLIVKVVPYSNRASGSGADPSPRQSARRWPKSNPAVGCHYFSLVPRLPPQPQSIAVHWPVPNYTAWWQRYMCENNLSRVESRVTTQPGVEPANIMLQTWRPTRGATTVSLVQLHEEIKNKRNKINPRFHGITQVSNYVYVVFSVRCGIILTSCGVYCWVKVVQVSSAEVVWWAESAVTSRWRVVMASVAVTTSTSGWLELAVSNDNPFAPRLQQYLRLHVFTSRFMLSSRCVCLSVCLSVCRSVWLPVCLTVVLTSQKIMVGLS